MQRETSIAELTEYPVDESWQIGADVVESPTRYGFWRYLRPSLVLSSIYLVLVFIAAVHPSLFTSQNPDLGIASARLLSPSAAHLFGTDNLGRDIFSRTVYGTKLSVGVSLMAMVIGLGAGGLIGLVAGSLGTWVDAVFMRVMDVLLSIPGLLISLAIVVALGYSPVKIALAVGIPEVGGFARLMRSQVMQIKGNQYVEAAGACGARRLSVLFRHILPNSLGPVLAFAIVEFGSAVLSVTALSFLGFGAQPPTPDWGNLISTGHDYLATSWWWTTMPGLVLIATVMSANAISHSFGVRRGHSQ